MDPVVHCSSSNRGEICSAPKLPYAKPDAAPLLPPKDHLLLPDPQKKEELPHVNRQALLVMHGQEGTRTAAEPPGRRERENGGGGKWREGKRSSMRRWTPGPTVPFIAIFKYADVYDMVLMVLGLLGAIGDGISTPLMMLVMGALINVFGNHAQYAGDHFMHEIRKQSLYFTYVAVGVFVASFLEAACWMRTGERQASRMRSKYLRAILRQEVGFFDLQGTLTAVVVNSVSADTLVIQDVISEKIVHFTVHVSTFLGGYLVAFYLSWRLAVVSICFLPLLVIPGLMYGKHLTGLSQRIHVEYDRAGIIAEQAISSIRTVFSFVGEQKIMQKFSAALDGAAAFGLKQGLAKGLAIGSNGITFAIWAFLGWYGSTLIIHHGFNGGKVVATGLGALIGGLALGMALPNVKYFSEARVLACHISEMIERVPEIDSDDMRGQTRQSVLGNLELRNVSFAYPSRPDIVIFKSFSLAIPAGKSVALVGSSGSGKSTIIALLERFYDPLSGEVLLDGINIKDLQLKWLRAQMGLVSQEPALFATTIKDNILFGKEDATMDEIVSAAKKSNAHNFITQLPCAYETQVGERGVQMSGGQKQRIAIARALIKNPPILLLDEATSALDAESERIVQEALDQAVVGRTTVVVAHRLSTIRHADFIAVVQNGQVVEIGKHDELVSKQDGTYAALVQSQQQRTDQDHNTDEARPSIGRMSTSTMFSSCSSPRASNLEPTQLEFLTAPKPPSFGRLLAMNSPEWKQAIFGCLGATGYGIVHPLYAFTLGSTISVFFVTDYNVMRRKIRVYSSIFAVVAMLSFLTNLIQHYNFAAMGERLTKRVRVQMLEKILSFEVGWFDQDENCSGAVCSRLATEANVVRSLVGDRISLIVQTLSAVIAACTFGLVIAWRLALVMIAVQPIVILCFYTKKVLLTSQNRESSRALEESGHLAAEAVGNHRTITAFSSQDKFLQLFDNLQAVSHKEVVKHSWVAGIGLGCAQFAMFCTWALDYWYGGKLMSSGHLTGAALFKTFFILVSTGRVIADAGSMTSDIAKGATAVTSVFSILDRVSKINPEDKEGEKLEKVKGNVEVKDVDFAYPSRPEVMILRSFNLKVKAGRSVALVGKSGSGKSTIIGLIERFYDPQKGTIRIDGKDIKKLHLRELRKHMALVNQEPTLFAGTIGENIVYGRENATEAEMVEAAKAANAHDFISSLTDGYETNTGDRGVQLSGGQKQRVAIARAILKNPAILLLDEATSALDAQAEKIVQDALDRIMVGRTTIVVAHRLSTIQNCDCIAVIEDGEIVEKGRHGELMGKGQGGAYYNLVRLQDNKPIDQSQTTDEIRTAAE